MNCFCMIGLVQRQHSLDLDTESQELTFFAPGGHPALLLTQVSVQQDTHTHITKVL